MSEDTLTFESPDLDGKCRHVGWALWINNQYWWCGWCGLTALTSYCLGVKKGDVVVFLG